MAFTNLDWLIILIAGLLVMCLLNLLANVAFARWAGRARKPLNEPRFVSVLVPARNETHNIQACMTSLLKQDHQNYEVIALNDDSTDDTGAILDQLAAQDSRLQVIHNHQPLPAGWNGKSRACQTLANAARGEWLLFVDADTRHKPHSICSGVEQALGLQVALFSVIPRQIIGSWGERLFLPAAFTLVYSFTVLWRIYLPPSSRFGTAAAIGQYLMVRRDAYFASGGHGAIRDKILDDQGLAVLFRRCGYRSALTDADFVTCRMYRGFRDMALGFSKNAFANLNGSIFVCLVFVAAILLLFFLPLITTIAGVMSTANANSASMPWPGWIAVALTILIFGLVNLRIGQPWWTGLLYPIQLLVGIGILLNSIRWRYASRSQWKGRTLKNLKK